jgi:uncharacterized protein DUF6209
MMATTALLEFFPGWQHRQLNTIERGQALRIAYDRTRLSPCFMTWRGAEFGDIVAYIRFHPRGEIIQGSLVEGVRNQENPPGAVVAHRSVPLEISVPDDATQAELWFHNFSQTKTRCDAWDSRFGENYWFDVGGLPPRTPARPVVYRVGAQPRPNIVNLLSARISKVNAFPKSSSGQTVGTDLQIQLDLTIWVSYTAWGANAWIDFHVFDGDDGLIDAQTLTLRYTGWGLNYQYSFAGKIYQGSTATPGSVSPRPDARKVQYRTYYEIDNQVFTDGILHQTELPADASI